MKTIEYFFSFIFILCLKSGKKRRAEKETEKRMNRFWLNMALEDAIKDDDLARVKHLLKQGADPIHACEDGSYFGHFDYISTVGLACSEEVKRCLCSAGYSRAKSIEHIKEEREWALKRAFHPRS